MKRWTLIKLLYSCLLKHKVSNLLSNVQYHCFDREVCWQDVVVRRSIITELPNSWGLDCLSILAQLVWQGRDFVEFHFNLMHRGCQESMIAVRGEGEGIKPEHLHSVGAFVASCRGAGLPSLTISHGFLE